jgi:CRP/FNR family transcriptional regulator, cyclic AMP receptor protein
MTFPAAIGYLASALVFATFWMKVPIRLLLAGAYPVAILHALLFPLNIVRLIELERLTAKVKAARSSDLSPEWLRPFTSSKDFSRGDCLFRNGDIGSEAYFIVSGQVSNESLSKLYYQNPSR